MFKWSQSNIYKIANDYVIQFQLLKMPTRVSETARLHKRRKAYENIGHLRSVIDEIILLKKRRALAGMFAKQVHCSKIEEVAKKYPH